MERMFYTIARGASGNKVIHYRGRMVYNKNDGMVDYTEFTFYFVAAVPVNATRLETIETTSTSNLTKLSPGSAKKLAAGYYGEEKRGRYLPVEEVNQSTPCGNYWCDGWWLTDERG